MQIITPKYSENKYGIWNGKTCVTGFRFASSAKTFINKFFPGRLKIISEGYEEWNGKFYEKKRYVKTKIQKR